MHRSCGMPRGFTLKAGPWLCNALVYHGRWGPARFGAAPSTRYEMLWVLHAAFHVPLSSTGWIRDGEAEWQERAQGVLPRTSARSL